MRCEPESGCYSVTLPGCKTVRAEEMEVPLIAKLLLRFDPDKLIVLEQKHDVIRIVP